MDDIQHSSSRKYKMASSYRSRWMCCARFGNKLNEEVCRIFPIWRLISGFGRQSEKFSRTCARIRRNFTPCHLRSCNFYVFQISWTCCHPLSLCKCFWKRKRESYRYLATIPVSVGDFPPKFVKWLTMAKRHLVDLEEFQKKRDFVEQYTPLTKETYGVSNSNNKPPKIYLSAASCSAH